MVTVLVFEALQIQLVSFINREKEKKTKKKKTISFVVEQGKNNIAFTCLFELGAMEEAIDLLIKTDRIPEAAMLARSYAPDKISEIVRLWKAGLESKNRKKIAESLADPAEYPNLFPELLNKKEDLVDLKEEVKEVVVKDEQVEEEEEEENFVDTEGEESPSLI